MVKVKKTPTDIGKAGGGSTQSMQNQPEVELKRGESFEGKFHTITNVTDPVARTKAIEAKFGDLTPQRREAAGLLQRDEQGNLVTKEDLETQQLQRLQAQGVFNEAPTQPNQLVISKQEDPEAYKRQVELALQSDPLLMRGITKLDAKNREIAEDLAAAGNINQAAYYTNQKLINRLSRATLKTAREAILQIRRASEITSDVPVVGDLISGILGDRPEIVQNFQSSLETKNQMATSIASDVKAGIMSTEDGFKALAALEEQTNNAEARIQQEAILSPAVRRSGELEDIQTDILELRQEIYRAKQEVAGAVIGEPDLTRLQLRLDEMRA